MARSLRLASLVAVSAIAMTACASGNQPTDGLRIDSLNFKNCGKIFGPITGSVSGWEISNPSSEAVRLTSLQAVSAEGVDLITTDVLPQGGVGVIEYPVTADAATAVQWSDRVPLAGYELQPHSHAQVETTVTLHPGAKSGRMQDFRIDFSQGGVMSSRESQNITINLQRGEDSCSSY